MKLDFMAAKILLIFIALFLGGFQTVQAAQKNTYAVEKKYLPAVKKIGDGTLKYAFWNVYTASLYSVEKPWNPSKPFVLTLDYLLDLDGKAIADRSVEEMQKQGFSDEKKLAKWQKQMSNLFPDVKKNSQLAGVYQPGKPTMFYHNGNFIGKIEGDDFAMEFFGIWLSEKTSEPELRKKLLGLK